VDSLGTLSNDLLYSAIAVYVLAMLVFTAEMAFGSRSRLGRSAAAVGAGASTGASVVPPLDAPPAADDRAERLGRVAVSLTALAFALHLAAVVARGLWAGRVPWGSMYEFSTAGALAVTGVFLVLLRREGVRYLGIWVVPAVLVTLGLAVTVLYNETAQLLPALRSYWLVIHVSAAVLSSGVFTVGAVVSVLYLVRSRAETSGRPDGYAARLPAAASLDRVAYRVHAFAFPLWTFAVVAGAIWAENAWGRYWGWDPKETWAFITWVVYAAYLHARSTAGWRGHSAAAIALVGYACFLFNYFGVNLLISGLHSYAGV